ncbi:MAG: glycoside hydrolase family 97 catalytic domain-containing protein [Deltaproteobacteria bacterium]|nr:glycoside hydrolase family 97 catalytic domain-containing protein [Deltaproteobacteria bacterium]
MCRFIFHAACLLGTLAGSAACAAWQAQTPRMPKGGWQVESPDRQLRVTVAFANLAGTAGYPAGERLYYRTERVAHGATTEIMPWSPLGIRRTDQAFVDGLKILKTDHSVVNQDYALVHGKRRRVHSVGVQETLRFANAAGAEMELVVRVFDTGFAFRYRFPESTKLASGVVSIVDEETGFRLPESSFATLLQHENPKYKGINYEGDWHRALPVGTLSPVKSGWSFPALFHTGGDTTFVLVTETDLDESYCGTHLQAESPAGVYRVAFPAESEALGQEHALPRSTLPWATPWRVVVVGSLATIVESTLVTDLARPSAVADVSWIHPGRASWSWWSDGSSPSDFAKIVPFIDVAAELGWEYTLVDAGWHLMTGGTWLDVLAHAKEKKVGVMLWYNSGGVLNDVLRAAPRDLMFDPVIRRAEMKKIAAAGVKGIKVDFFDSDKQTLIKQYIDILKDAADAHLLVNFHGATLPRGWERTYPHMIGVEGVQGAENYRFNRTFPERAPWHNTIMPFTRNAVGPMDYTPVTFSNSTHAHLTTDAHELALSIVFETGIVHFPDHADIYRALPDEARSLLSTIPSAWDDTRLLEGFPGKWVVVARRAGRDWYIGGINGEKTPREVTIPLNMLDASIYAMTMIADGNIESRFTMSSASRKTADTVSVIMEGNGGFSLRLVPEHPTTP